MNIELFQELTKIYNEQPIVMNHIIEENQDWVSMLVLCTKDINQYVINDIDMYHVELKPVWFSKNDFLNNDVDTIIEKILNYINFNKIDVDENDNANIYLLHTYIIEQKFINFNELEEPMKALECFKNDFIQYFKSKRVNSKIINGNYFMIDLNEADEWYKNCKALHKDSSKATETNF